MNNYKKIEGGNISHKKMKWFTIRERLPSYNEVVQANRSGWQAGAKLKKHVEQTICAYIEEQTGRTLEPINGPVIIWLRWHEPNRKRDVDNVQSSQKFILDALQKAGILPNDSPKFVRQVYHRVSYDCTQNDGKGYVGVYLELLEDES